MPRPYCIEGHAIVSADGMIADASGVQPPGLVVPADQELFRRGLDRSAVVAHGRFSQEPGAQQSGRKRIVLTGSIAAVAPHPRYPSGILWNPEGAPLEQALAAVGATDGVLAVIGGTAVFGLFLEIGYDAFHLSRAGRVRLPGGRPVFPQVPGHVPEDLLADHGLLPGPRQILDAAADVALVTWTAAGGRRGSPPAV